MSAPEAGDVARKRAAAVHAVETYVRDGMALGLGTGTTAAWVVRGIGERLADGRLARVVGVPTSVATERLAAEVGVPLTRLGALPMLDLTLDGADEIDPALRLVKGLGGAHLREKVVALSSERMIVVGDDSKLVRRLGERAALPVEVIPFARPLAERLLLEAGWTPRLRLGDDGPFLTDEGNHVLDCRREDWSDPEALARELAGMTGVVEHGFFLGVASAAVVGTADGVRVLTPTPA